MRVLQCFGANTPDLGNREISEMTGLPKPTVSRLTYTLVELGYLRRCVGSARFELANRVLCLGYPVLARLQFRLVAMPHIRRLALEINGTASVSVRDRLGMVNLENYTHRDVFRRRPGTGVSVDLFRSASGLAWLVGATPDERDRVLREVAHSAPAELDGVRADHAMGLQQLARHGYVQRRGVHRPDTTAIATPLRRRSGEELLILACGVHAPGAQGEAIEQRSGELLLEASRSISEGLIGG